MLKCKICGKYYKHLGSHIWHGHKIFAVDYKTKFGLDHNTALITDEIKEKKRIKFWLKPTHKKNFKGCSKYWFKKGRIPTRGYFSVQSKKRYLVNFAKMNKTRRGKCPVCNIVFDAMPSHLYNKHKLLQVK